MAANLQYNVYRFFEYWQQGIDKIFGDGNDNSDQPVRCPFYRDGDINLYAGATYIDVSGYIDPVRCYARCTITNDSLSFLHDFRPIDYSPNQFWTEEDRQEAYEVLVSRVNQNNFVLGMDENHVGENLYADISGMYQFIVSENSLYPFEMDWNSNKKYGTMAIRYDGQVFDIDTNYDNPFTLYNFGYIAKSDTVGTNISPAEVTSIDNNYYEYHNHYTEDGITVYYSDDYTFITYEGEKTYNQVQNVVNNAYNNDNSVTIKVNAPSYETVKNGDRHPYYIAPLQPLQIPELGEMSLPAGDFGDAPKILAESVNEMTGLLDHLGLTAIFIVCALLVFIIRKVRD